jgi:hypothetical protein
MEVRDGTGLVSCSASNSIGLEALASASGVDRLAGYSGVGFEI